MPDFFQTAPVSAAQALRLGQLYGSSRSLFVAEQIARHPGLTVVVCRDMADAEQLEHEIRFFGGEAERTYRFPDLETLPYDQFSPHQDIVSERIRCLATINDAQRGFLILPISTLLQKVAPARFIRQRSLRLRVGERRDPGELRDRLTLHGYRAAAQVEEHGEFSARGSILDLFPMGSTLPFRIDFFDDEVETIRSFDPETQLSIDKIEAIDLLPAQEYPLDEDGIREFRLRFRETFEVDPNQCPVYVDISAGMASPGVEYYLPLFFDEMACLFDYLPPDSLFLLDDAVESAAGAFLEQIHERYQSRRYNTEWPLLEPAELFLEMETLQSRLQSFPRIIFSDFKLDQSGPASHNLDTQSIPQLTLQTSTDDPARVLRKFIDKPVFDKILFSADSAGRREFLIELLQYHHLRPSTVATWAEFLERGDNRYFVTASALQHGMTLESKGIAVITETQLFGERAVQRRRRKYRKTRDAESLIQSLADLQIGAPVVHEDHGVGRYQGLKTLTVSGIATEFLCIEYAQQDKLYVPVSSLHLISRYAGADDEHAPLHRLGTEQWQRSKRKAQQKIHDVAVELLDIQARREAMQGFAHQLTLDDYQQFVSEFPFEETPDQDAAIDAVIEDLQSARPMDRIVCGDVGFGKTEVCMRAAFIAVNSDSQVAVLVPTTLLARQHFQNFLDRFANWPVRIASLTRFSSQKSLDETLAQIAAGKIDIVIGTHKLLSDSIKYRHLGLLIIDEEHRFGVRHKEKLKALRADVDLLTLTATPIPRTLNMSLSGMRDLSIIATPPMQRHAIKTFVSRWNQDTIVEGCQRELKRGGQIYFLHNEIKTIDKTAQDLQLLLPEARIGIVHGQHEREGTRARHARFLPPSLQSAGVHHHHRERYRRAHRQHYHHQPRRQAGAGPAAPDSGPGRPLASPRLRLPDRAARVIDDRRRAQAPARDRVARRPWRRLHPRHARPRDPWRRRNSRRRAERTDHRDRFHPLRRAARARGEIAEVRPAGRFRPADHARLRSRFPYPGADSRGLYPRHPPAPDRVQAHRLGQGRDRVA